MFKYGLCVNVIVVDLSYLRMCNRNFIKMILFFIEAKKAIQLNRPFKLCMSIYSYEVTFLVLIPLINAVSYLSLRYNTTFGGIKHNGKRHNFSLKIL